MAATDPHWQVNTLRQDDISNGFILPTQWKLQLGATSSNIPTQARVEPNYVREYAHSDCEGNWL